MHSLLLLLLLLSCQVHKLAPEHQGSLRLATRMCQAATACADKLAACTAGNHMASADDRNAEAYTLYLQFKAALYLRKTEELQAITQQMITHPDVGADKLHLMFSMCTQEPHK